MNFLKNKLNVVITGGASGIGKEIALAYDKEGCEVFICDNSKDSIDSFSTESSSIFLTHADVGKFEEVQFFFDKIREKVDSIDVLINCAGIAGPTAPLEEIDPHEWNNTINVNLNGMFYTLKEAVPLLKNSKQGSILNIASSASFFGFPLRSPYSASKWATIGLTKTLAMELGGHNIRVNAICPGSVKGTRINQVIKADAIKQKKSRREIENLYLKQVSMKTFIEAKDVAYLSLFLSSDYGRFISGQAIGLDGHTEGLSINL